MCTQPSTVVNYAAAHSQIAVTAKVAAYLSTTENSTVAVSTVVLAAQPYIPSFRRPNANPRLTQDHNLNAGRLRSDGTVRITTAANVTTTEITLPALTAYFERNAHMVSQFGQASALNGNLVHHY